VFMKNRETDEWLKQNEKSTREFLRKWGHFCKHDALLKPIIPSKYDIGFIVKNCNDQLLETLEPWCSTMYIDNWNVRELYIKSEQFNTSFDLDHKIRPYDTIKQNDVLVSIDGNQFGNNDFRIIQTLSEILDGDDQIQEMIMVEPTHFVIENLQVTIHSLETYEQSLIHNNYIKKE